MKNHLVRWSLSAALLLSVSLSSAIAQGRWEFLGSRKVNFSVDRDVIPVTWRGGSFDALRIDVRGGAVNMHKCVIHFENGGVREIELRYNFGPRRPSRLIDLPGNNRRIEKIVFWYDTKNASPGRAEVLVYGRH